MKTEEKKNKKKSWIDAKKEKTVKKNPKTKKKKIKTNVLNGIDYVKSTFNKTIIFIVTPGGNVIPWA